MIKTIELVTESIRNDRQVIAACEAIDIELQQIYNAIPDILFWPNTDNLVPPLLDIIAWEMHVDVWAGWEGALTVEEKRALINSSIDWHQHKGTKYAVEQMLRTVFTKGYVQEWYQYGGNPYFFKLVISETITDPDKLAQLTNSINAVKNVRSWMEGYEVEAQKSLQQLYIAIAVCVMVVQKIPVSTNERSTAIPILPLEITLLDPNNSEIVSEGGLPFELSVTGTGFIAESQVNFGSFLPDVTYVSDTLLTADITVAMIRDQGIVQVSVSNLEEESNSLPFYLIAVMKPDEGPI